MKVFVIGSGGREHALIWKIKQSPAVKKIYCAPGNGGIADLAECVNISADDIKGLLKFAKTKRIDLTVAGPEAPLVAGIVDAFEKEKLDIFGPRQQAAQLEGSKVFAKEFMTRWKIPTASFAVFTQMSKAQDYIKSTNYPLVIKADGLAAGKGVLICQNFSQAQDAVVKIMQEKIFEEAGNKVVIEECLEGEEISLLAICDGHDYVLLASAQDHKRIFDDDLGPNTGGMGAYSPASIIDEGMLKKIEEVIIQPTIRGMEQEGNPFTGVLYAGLMITVESPMVLEYNVRMGDPETQAILPRLNSDLFKILFASARGKLKGQRLRWDNRPCVCVVLSSGGYPGKYEVGKEIFGLESAAKERHTFVFHAGTKKEGNRFVTSGGRVLGVASLGKNIAEAIPRAYQSVEKIQFDKCFFRRDIGAKAMMKPNARSRRHGVRRLK